ncbi:MAG: DUF2157 domain-containing protein [Synergistaceae bacterium]|jgi:uncharacterized membrane protein|nr:DUF2157 domain-containing protein [Synergistaceae bacterium]
MERKISESKHRFLSEESRGWVDGGIITEEQRGGIIACYTVVRALPAAVMALGAAMIGIGVLSFIAANWNVIPPFLKIVMIVGSYICSAAAAFMCEKKGHKTASDVLLFFSGFLVLGGFALLAQIFHLSGDITGLLGLWLAVYAPTFFLVRSVPVYALYETVSIAYVCIIYWSYLNRSWERGDQSSLILGPWQPYALLLLLAVSAWYSWYEESRAPAGSSSRLRDFFIGGSTRRAMLGNFFIVVWFSWMCVINSRHESFLPYVFGILVIGAAINAAAWKLDASDLDWQAMLLISAAGLALTFPFIWSSSDLYSYSRDRSVLTPHTAASGAALGAYLVYRIIRRRKGGGFSTFMFCVLLARWYFDMFFDFMDKSIFFLTGGAVLLSIAYACRKWRGYMIPQGGNVSEDAGAGEGGDDE